MIGRRRLSLGCFAALATSALSRPGWAEEAPVPVQRQSELLVRIAAYDRNLPARAQGTARVLIVMSDSDADSRGQAASMDVALTRAGHIAGLPVVVATAPLTAGDAIASRCKAEHVSIVYVTQGLDALVGGLVASLDGGDILSVSALPRYVQQGIVLGFDLVSGNPTLLFHLTRARKQNVAMDPKVVQLMQVYR
jgi:YfiR/HmsC-like